MHGGITFIAGGLHIVKIYMNFDLMGKKLKLLHDININMLVGRLRI